MLALLRHWLLAPRRLRELGYDYARLVDVIRTYKAENHRLEGIVKQRRTMAEYEKRLMAERAAYTKQPEKEVDRLRELNGATNRKYVYVQDAYDQLLLGRSPRY